MAARFFFACILCLVLNAEAQAGQVCGWLVEKTKPHGEHDFDIWLGADQRLEFLYQIGGSGVTAEGFRAHSPSSASYLLNPGKPERVWGFGTTVPTPSKVDISIEIHSKPADIFSDEPTPLIAQFTFARDVPDGEKKAPPILAAKQCAAVP
jgi:hypothetical protein